MKRLLFICLIAFAVSTANAAQVSPTTARTVASNFLQNLDANSVNLTLVYSRTDAFYVFGNQTVFVIVAADDRVTPILGYSTESAFRVPQNEADTTVGNNFWGWMRSYEAQINYLVDNNIAATKEITYQWNNLLRPDSKTAVGVSTAVAPLLTTTWGQGWPYNSMCPADPSGSGGHVWVGCVGTAMAQILKFWNGPAEGLGSFSYQSGTYPVTNANFNTPYNWANMPNSTATVNADISTIMYHTAVSVMSMWGAGGTSVMYYSGEDPMTRAFKNYFKMASSTMQYMEKAGYSGTQWDSLLQTELVAGRPVYYRGDGSFGHAWVCDGVDNSNMYHFNFGWDGNYNGYYTLDNINPGGNTLTNNQNAIMGIKPNDGSTLATNTTWAGTMNFTTNIWVPDAITLTVNPGAEIKFAPGCGLYIFGRLVCNGTDANYAKLTAIDTTNGWNGIRFDNNYNARLAMADNDTSKLIYTQVEYSQSSGVSCIAYGKLILDHCKINNNHSVYGAGAEVGWIPIRITYCEFYNNHASIYGGGIFASTTNSFSSSIDHNYLHNNVADGTGGGFYFMNVNDVAFTCNTSYQNYAPNGAGGAIMYGTIPLTNNKICNNNASSSGGGLYTSNYQGHIINNLIANNSSGSASGGSGGGLNLTQNSTPILTDNTICNNSSWAGGGLNFSSGCNATLKNCIVYGNQGISFGNQVAIGFTTTDPYFDHCNIQGGMSGFGGPGSGSNYTTANYTNNIDLLPQFVSPSAGAGTGYEGLSADWGLLSGSPCINSADTTGISNLLPATDLAGNPRINGIIDMGAYEYAVFKQLQIKLLLQGLYSGSGLMLPAQSATGNQFAAGTADVVSVSLHEAANFSTTVFTQNNVPIALNGQLQVNVPDMYSGTYYLHLKHRNSIGVVSAIPVSMAGNPIIYDFTDAASKAFGNNQLDVDGFFALNGGDANQDGSVDALDLIAIDNASNSFATGYFSFDVNGDGAADALDLILTDNNSLVFVQEITP